MEGVNEQGSLELDEYDIVQNYTLGAHALREFVKHFQKGSGHNDGPILPLVFPILPLVFNEETATSISKRHFSLGSFAKTLRENKTLYADLQERMEKMSSQTLRSLSVAFSSGLLRYDPVTTQVTVGDSSNPSRLFSAEYITVLASARRLGNWFAKSSQEQILAILKIHF